MANKKHGPNWLAGSIHGLREPVWTKSGPNWLACGPNWLEVVRTGSVRTGSHQADCSKSNPILTNLSCRWPENQRLWGPNWPECLNLETEITLLGRRPFRLLVAISANIIALLFEIPTGQAYKDPFQRGVSVGHDSYIVGSALGGAINICPNGPQLRLLKTLIS